MTEDTNQIIENAEESANTDADIDELFENYEGEETEEDTNSDTESGADNRENGELFEIKASGQEYKLTREQVIENAQKGLDYDGLRADRDALRAQMSLVKELAKQSGTSPGEFLMDIQLSNMTRQYIEKGFGEDGAREMAETMLENKLLKSVNGESDIETQARQNTERVVAEHIAEFETLFPNVSPSELEINKPQAYSAIMQGIKIGISPALAYQRYLTEEKDAEIAMLRQEAKNKNTTPGSVQGGKTRKSIADIILGD